MRDPRRRIVSRADRARVRSSRRRRTPTARRCVPCSVLRRLCETSSQDAHRATRANRPVRLFATRRGVHDEGRARNPCDKGGRGCGLVRRRPLARPSPHIDVRRRAAGMLFPRASRKAFGARARSRPRCARRPDARVFPSRARCAQRELTSRRPKRAAVPREAPRWTKLGRARASASLCGDGAEGR